MSTVLLPDINNPASTRLTAVSQSSAKRFRFYALPREPPGLTTFAFRPGSMRLQQHQRRSSRDENRW
jgi:hypothetical protein